MICPTLSICSPKLGQYVHYSRPPYTIMRCMMSHSNNHRHKRHQVVPPGECSWIYMFQTAVPAEHITVRCPTLSEITLYDERGLAGAYNGRGQGHSPCGVQGAKPAEADRDLNDVYNRGNKQRHIAFFHQIHISVTISHSLQSVQLKLSCVKTQKQ